MSAAHTLSPDETVLFPFGCGASTPETFLEGFQELLKERGFDRTFRTAIPLAPMSIVNIGRLQRWVEKERPETLHPLWLDSSKEKEVVRHFAAHGIHVAIIRTKALPLSYRLVALV